MTLKVAIVHPWFIVRGGGEKVIDALAAMYPQADFFALIVAPEELSPAMRGRTIHTTILSKVPGAKRFYQHLFPFYRMAVQELDVSGYDLVVSSGGPASKGVIVAQDAVHIHYSHSPVRFLWDRFHEWRRGLPRIARPIFNALASSAREWDFNTAQRVDAFVANSDYVAQRIRTYYRRDSVTIPPPVEVDRGYLSDTRGDYYITVGRMVPGKRTELLIEACNRLGRRLKIVGRGPEEKALRALAGPTIEFTGPVDDATLSRLYAEARAFLFAADEDFGIVMVEAQSYGLPVIAYGKGGAREIVRDIAADPAGSGLFFADQTADAVADAIVRFEAAEPRFDRAAIRGAAQGYAVAVFAERFRAVVDAALQDRLRSDRVGF